jgi:hypothetical protein
LKAANELDERLLARPEVRGVSDLVTEVLDMPKVRHR